MNLKRTYKIYQIPYINRYYNAFILYMNNLYKFNFYMNIKKI